MAMPVCRMLFVSASCCLLILSSIVSGKRDDLKDYKVDQLGVSTILWCNESVQYRENPNDTVPVSWMLPNLTVLSASSGRFHISEGNWSLAVANITRNDLGQYHCMMRMLVNETTYAGWYLARLGLNAQGPYFEDLWDKYETNTIIAISAGFGFLALAIGAMLVWHYRYEARHDTDTDTDDSKQSNGTPSYTAYGAYTKTGEPNTYENKAFDGTDDDAVKVPDSTTAYGNKSTAAAGDGTGLADDGGTAF